MQAIPSFFEDNIYLEGQTLCNKAYHIHVQKGAIDNR